MRAPHAVAATGLILALGALAGCGGSSSSAKNPQTAKPVNPNGAETSPAGDIPDNQAFVRYAPPGAGFSVKVPEGWSRTASSHSVTFTDKLNSIRIQWAKSTAAPAKKHTSSFAQGKPDPVTGKARTLAVEHYVFSDKGRVADLTLSGAKGADNVDPWKIVTSSLRWGA
jgi:hypothetical protein